MLRQRCFDTGAHPGAGSPPHKNMRRRAMVTLTRADGNWAGDLDLSRRSIAPALPGGYAVAAFDANAEPIHTDEAGLATATAETQARDRQTPGHLARPAGARRPPGVFVNSA